MAKAKSKKVTRKTGKKAELPKGYKVIGRAPSWNPEKNPVIEGIRGKSRTVRVNKDTDDEYDTETMIVTDETIGAVTVWKSAMLADLFDSTEDGDLVRIEFLGFGEAKKGQKPVKLFECAAKD